MARILVVDDDQSFRKMIDVALRGAGHCVTLAADGLAAVGMAMGGRQFDLLITDVFMPEMDGIEVIRAFRAHSPTIRILTISGGGSASGSLLLRQTTKLGADEALPKPFTLDRLLAVVHKMLAG